MTLGIQVKAVGVDEMNKTLKRVFGYATAVEGVELTSKQRESHIVHSSAESSFAGDKGKDIGGKSTNAQVFEWLAAGGRDFGAADDNLNKEIAATFSQELQRQINRKNQNVDSAAASIYRKAMKTYRAAVVKRIMSGSAPGGVKPLSREYREWKEEALGFTHPIGVATGQMLRELEVAGRIKLIKAAGVSGFKLPALPKT